MNSLEKVEMLSRIALSFTKRNHVRIVAVFIFGLTDICWKLLETFRNFI